MRDHDKDHRLMRAPHLRLQRENDQVKIWDLRLTQPGVGYLDPAVLHTLEHFFGHDLPLSTDRVWMAAPLGCGTGLYIVTDPLMDRDDVRWRVTGQMREIEFAAAVPLADPEHCGRPQLHDLAGAKAVADFILRVGLAR